MGIEFEKPKRILSLDILKGLCAIFVVISHCPIPIEQTKIALFPFTVSMAVPFFLVTSGYLFANSFENSGITEFADAYKLRSLCNRIIGYLVPFTIIILIQTIVNEFIWGGTSIGSVASVYLKGGGGPGGYYSPILIQLVFLYPVVYFTIKSKPIAGTIGWAFFNGFYELIRRVYEINDGLYRMSIFRYTFLIAVGAFLYLYQKEIKKRYLLISFVLGICYILVVSYLGYETKYINNLWRETAFPVAFYALPVFYLLVHRFKNIRVGLIAFIGKASYSIFLTQMVFFCYSDFYLKWFPKSPWLQAISIVLVCVAVGCAFYVVTSFLTRIARKCLNKWLPE